MRDIVSRGKVIAKNAAFLAGGQALTWISTLLFILVVPRALGPSEWGAWSVALAITAVAGSLAGLGLNTLLTKEIARDLERTSEYVGAALVAQMILAAPFVLIVVGAAMAPGYSLHTRVIIALTTAYTLVYFIGIPLASALQALEQMHYLTLGNIITRVLVSFAAVGVVLIPHSHNGVNAICVIGLIAALVGTGLQVRWLSRSAPIRLRWDWPLIRRIVVASLPYWGTGLFVTIYTWVDAVMLSFMTTTTVVGWYGAATRLFNTLLFLPTILTTALLPALSDTFKRDRAQMRALIHRGFTLQTSLSLPIAAGTFLLGPAIIPLLFGKSFAPAAPALMVLALTLIPMYMNILVSQFLVAADRQVLWTRVMAGMCLLNPAINLVTITYFDRVHHNGAIGAAAALLTTETAMAGIGLWLIPRDLLGRAAWAPIVRAALATAVMAGVVWALRGQFLGIPLVAGVLTFFAVAIVLRVFPTEDLLLLAGFGRKAARKLGLRYRLWATADERAAGVPLPLGNLLAADFQAWRRYEWGFGAANKLSGDLGVDSDTPHPLRAGEIVRLWWAYPGVRATVIFRLSAEARRLRLPVLPGALQRRNVRRYGVDIAPAIPVGPGLYMPYPVGTVIRARAIGGDCRIIGTVTIDRNDRSGVPTIADHVLIGPGARVLGAIQVGAEARIGANAVVMRDVPEWASAFGIPARVVVSSVRSAGLLEATADLLTADADTLTTDVDDTSFAPALPAAAAAGNGRTNGHNGADSHTTHAAHNGVDDFERSSPAWSTSRGIAPRERGATPVEVAVRPDALIDLDDDSEN